MRSVFLEFNHYCPCFNNQFSVLPMEVLPNSLTFAVIFEIILFGTNKNYYLGRVLKQPMETPQNEVALSRDWWHQLPLSYDEETTLFTFL